MQIQLLYKKGEIKQSTFNVQRSWLYRGFINHLNTEHQSHLNTEKYGCPEFKWLSHVTWGTIAIAVFKNHKPGFFKSSFQTTIWILDHLTTVHKSTIWIPDWSRIQIVPVHFWMPCLTTSLMCKTFWSVGYWGLRVYKNIPKNTKRKRFIHSRYYIQ